MVDTLIDFTKRDYVEVQGALKRDPANGLLNACYIRLTTPLGSYWGDISLGSRLHELQREKDVARVSKLARQYAQQALQPILDDGRASQININTEQPGNGRLILLIEVVDAAQQRFTFRYPVGVQ